MTQSHIRLLGMLSAFAVGLSGPSTSFGVTIDNFEQASFSVVDQPGFDGTSTTQTGLTAPGSLSGYRMPSVRSISSTNTATLSLTADSPDVLDDSVVLSAGTQAQVDITLIDVPAASAYNLRSFGSHVRAIVEQAPPFADIRVTFTDTAGRTGGSAINVNSPGAYYWPMNPGANVDHSAVTKLVLSFDAGGISPSPVDYRVSDISIVPEPSAGVALLLLGSLFWRRRS